MPAGRPTKYHDGMIQLAETYMDQCGRDNTTLPTIEGLSLELGVDDEQISIWANEKVKDENGKDTNQLLHPEFSATIKRLKAKQKQQLMDDGMYGGKEVNSTMAIFLLKVNHGMVETSHTDLTSKGEKLQSSVLVQLPSNAREKDS